MARFLEKDFQTKFSKYVKHVLSHKKGSFAYELKVSRNGYLNFKALAQHQKYSLLGAKHGVAHHKIADEGISQKPFDGFVLVERPAYVGVMFNTAEQRKEFYLIDIDAWLDLRERIDRKSITEELAAEIGERHEFPV